VRNGRASWTAAEVARKLVGLAYDPRLAPLLPAGAAPATERLLVALRLLPRWMLAVARSRMAQNFGYRLGNRLGAHPAAFGLRKRFVDDEVRAALAGGARQVLVVGAGYDTLALRLAAEYSDRTFVEVDHPATQASKRAGIAAIGAERPNLVLLAADLARVPLAHALATLRAWDATRASVVVAEGVLVYLPPAAVGEFFTTVHAITGPGSRVVFTWVRGIDGRPDLGRSGPLVSALMALGGEPWQWSVPDEATLEALLARSGFCYRPDPARFDPCLRYVEPSGIDHRGWAWAPELYAVAERSSVTPRPVQE
jgi:methyltransferase (TIGR00027 family)